MAYQTFGQTGSMYSANNCSHDGSEEFDTLFALTIGERKVHFCGSKEAKVLDNVGDDPVLIINLIGSKQKPVPPVITHSDLEYDFSKHEVKRNFKEIVIDCKDMNAPMLYPSFWLHLRQIIENDPINFKRVVCCCFGGHGRTGTALACLYLAFFDDTVKHAIKVVKKLYCDNAIESSTQEQYILACAKFFKVYFDAQSDDTRLTPLSIPKSKRARKPKGKTVVDATSNSEDALEFMEKVCFSCKKKDATVLESEIGDKTVMECDICYQERIKGAAQSGKTDLANIEDDRIV